MKPIILKPSGQNDTEAIREAIKQVNANGSGEIRFTPGRYRVSWPAQQAHPIFLLNEAHDVRIHGDGARILGEGRVSLFGAFKCRNLQVTGLEIDWPKPLFVQGRLDVVKPEFIEVVLESGYPVMPGEPVGAFMEYDPATRKPTRGGRECYNNFSRSEAAGPDRLRIYLSRPTQCREGQLLVVRHQVYGFNTFYFTRCQDVRMERCTVFGTPGMAFIADTCTNVTLDRFHVRILPGSGRMMSATADACHFGGCKGQVTVTGGVYEGMGDDAINCKSGLYLSLRRREDDHTILGQHNLKMASLPDPGDRMEVSHVEDMLPYATLTVASAEILPESENMHRVAFREPLPSELREGDVFGNATRAPRLRVSGITAKNNRARGILCQTRGAVVENSTFDGCSGAGIMVMTEVVYFFESIGTRDVTVRNNRFLGTNWGAASSEAPINVMAYLKDFALPPKPGVHRNTVIEGNLVSDGPGAGLHVAGVDGIVIRNNRFIRMCQSMPANAQKRDVVLRSSRNIRLGRNDTPHGIANESAE